MADVFTKKKRSEIMSRIRGKNTSAERLVFSFLNKQKIYFQKHYPRVPGKPDIALPRKKRAIFLDGDFWHGKNLKETQDRLPNAYWKDKIRANLKRDLKSRRQLRDSGWKVMRIWESELEKDREKFLEVIKVFLTDEE